MGSISAWGQLIVGEIALSVSVMLLDRVMHFRERNKRIIALSVLFSLPILAMIFPLIQTVRGGEQVIFTTIGIHLTILVGGFAIFRAVKLSQQSIAYDVPLSTIPLGILVFGYLFNLVLTKIVGVVFVVIYGAYILFVEKEYEREIEPETPHAEIVQKNYVLLMLSGFVLLVLGGLLVIQGFNEIFILGNTKLSGLQSVLLSVLGVLPVIGHLLSERIRTKTEAEDVVDGVIGSNFLLAFGALGVMLLLFVEIPVLPVLEITLMGGVTASFVGIANVGKKYWITRMEGVLLVIVGVLYLLGVSMG